MTARLLSQQQLEDIRCECFSEDIPFEAEMLEWTEDGLREYFLSGGAQRPLASSSAEAPSSVDAQAAAASPPAETLPCRKASPPAATLARPAELLGGGGTQWTSQDWRRNAALRKTHWLCHQCDRVSSREMVACPTCHATDLSSSSLSAADAALLASRLERCPLLRDIDVSHNPLGPKGVEAIARTLVALPSLTRLQLSGTGASDAGAVAVAEALSAAHENAGGRWPPLRELGLMGCSIKAQGAASFTALLRSGMPFLDLGLGWNKIDGDAAKALAHAAVSARQVERFCGLPIGDLRRGQLPPVPPLSERDRARRPQIDPAAELYLQGCGCGAPGGHAVAALLPRLPPLRAIVMPFQDLRGEGAEAIAVAASQACPQLSFLMLSRNDVDGKAYDRIEELFPQLDTFHLRVNNRGG